MWLVPSRGRPHLVQRLFDSGFREKGVLIIDEDQPSLYDNVRLPFGWKKLVLPRMFLSPKLNTAYQEFKGEPWYGILNDDHLPITPNWERKVIDSAGSKSMAWPDDNYAQRISSHVKGGDLVGVLGWFVCPRMNHYWLDDADELIAKEVGGKFLKDVVVSHEHANAGRAPMDRTYMERPSNPKDKAAFEAWRENEWPALKVRLNELR